MRLIADRLLHAFTGAPAKGTRFAMTDELLSRLSERRRLVVIGEAQNLTRDCFEYLRHLHDDPDTRFGLLFDGGDGCWEVLAREPMLSWAAFTHTAAAICRRTGTPQLDEPIARSAITHPARRHPVSTAATVVYDLEDDIAVVREIRVRAAREPHSLVVAIAPDAHAARGVIWAILRALGKRIEHLKTPLTWGDGGLLSKRAKTAGHASAKCP